MKKIPLTLQDHTKIAAWLTQPIVPQMFCDIINAYGRGSRAARLARKLENTVQHLRSEMEERALADGYRKEAMGLYYPQS